MVTHPYYIYNALIVNENTRFPGAVFINNGRISEIFNGNAPSGFIFPEETDRIDAKQKYLFPGVIDDHVHFREPGLTAKGDLFTESKAAVAGGVTSFMDMPNTIPKAITLEILEEKYTLAAQKSLANYSFFLGATNDNLAEIEKADPTRICGLKVFLGASTGEMLVDDRQTLDHIFAKSPLLIAVHAEEESIVRNNLREFEEKFGTNIPVFAHPLIRSEDACFKSSVKAVNLALKNDTRLHLLHLSTAKELALLQNDRPLAEKKVTGEVCIHHLWFDDRDYQDLGSRIKWNPAIKTSRDREAMLEAVLNDTIDIIATDHAPHLTEEKQNPYLTCPSGGPLIQHSLVAMLGFYHLGKISLEKIVNKMCHGPAILYRINKRGFIRKGYHADLLLIDPDDPWMVSQENILYKCRWSPFERVTFKSRVTHTWVNGNLVFNEGKFNDSVKGQRLEFLC
ncbi:MAG: dihydroorotase [Bacteroidales bacterium]|jgi:dihydroorotase|nr:dihydroorotase [Bacteroidales bacterium]